MNEFQPVKGNNSNVIIYKRFKKPIPPLKRTLSYLISSLQGQVIVVELKNDTEIYGSVDEVDKFMNITLTDVRETLPDGTITHKDVIHISGSSIRYCHFAKEMSAKKQLSAYTQVTDRLVKQAQPHSMNREKSHENKRLRLDDSIEIDSMDR